MTNMVGRALRAERHGADASQVNTLETRVPLGGVLKTTSANRLSTLRTAPTPTSVAQQISTPRAAHSGINAVVDGVNASASHRAERRSLFCSVRSIVQRTVRVK